MFLGMTVDFAPEVSEQPMTISDLFDDGTQVETLPWETMVVNVTPELAEKWLHDSNTVNRKLDKSHVGRLAQALKEGTYQTTPQGISFSPFGDLIDGHHRLSAISMARVTQPMVVFYGVDPKTFIVFDSISKGRTLSDIVKTSGLAGTNAAQVAASYRLLWNWQAGRNNSGAASQLSSTQLMAMHEQNPAMIAAVTPAAKVASSCGIPTPVIAVAMHLISTERSDVDSTEFFSRLETGANLASDSPILAMRNFVMKKRSTKTRVNPTDWLHALFKAWVAWVDGRTMTNLRVSVGEKRPDIMKAGGVVVKPRAARQGIQLADLLQDGLILPNARLVATDPLHQEVAFVRGDGTIECGVRSFSTPIEAATFVRGGTTNGWVFWAVAGAERNVPLDEIRAAYIRARGL